jgi:Flp pilus assembly protein TadG
MNKYSRNHARKNERGVSFLLVVAGMFSILAMAALAVDVVTMYLAKSEAQKAADAAALAGAKMFVLSGITSGSGVTNICGAGDASNKLADTVAAANQVGGVTAAVTNVTCNLANAENPQLTVTVARTNLPTFFGRIFGRQTASVSASATAEAYNNSGHTAQLEVASVKPWLIPNCNPAQPLTNCLTPYFFNSGSNYSLNNPSAYLGSSQQFIPATASPGQGVYYPVDPNSLTHANVCPSGAVSGCPGTLGTGTSGGPAGYVDDIACASNAPTLACGAQVNIYLGALSTDTITGAQCLMHTNNPSNPPAPPDQPQDWISPGLPTTITGGDNNPNPSLRDVANISRSDSVVTVPVFDWTTNPCPLGACTPVTVIGFLQLGVNTIDNAAPNPGKLTTVIMNAVGCPAPTGTPISGGGLTPIPVRLIQ